MSSNNLTLYRVLVKLGATDSEAESAATLDTTTLATGAQLGAVREDLVAQLGAVHSLARHQPGGSVQLQVWTDRRMVPYSILDVTDAQFAARRVMVTVNPYAGIRLIEARHAPQF